MSDDLPQVGTDERGQESQTFGQEPEAFDAEYVQQLRKEAASYRKRLRELEEQLKHREGEWLAEREQQQKRLADLEAQHRQARETFQESVARYEVMLAASRAGVVDPEAAWQLLDRQTLEFDEHGQPTNVADAVRKLLEAKPYLAGSSAVSPTNPSRASVTLVFRRSQLRDPQFFQAHREDIFKALAEGRIEED